MHCATCAVEVHRPYVLQLLHVYVNFPVANTSEVRCTGVTEAQWHAYSQAVMCNQCYRFGLPTTTTTPPSVVEQRVHEMCAQCCTRVLYLFAWQQAEQLKAGGGFPLSPNTVCSTAILAARSLCTEAQSSVITSPRQQIDQHKAQTTDGTEGCAAPYRGSAPAKQNLTYSQHTAGCISSIKSRCPIITFLKHTTKNELRSFKDTVIIGVDVLHVFVAHDVQGWR